MKIIDWTGEHTIDRDDIYHDLYKQQMFQWDEMAVRGYIPLYDLIACVLRDGQRDWAESIVIASGLTEAEVDLEVRLTNLQAVERWPHEVVDYSKLEFYGQRNHNMTPKFGPFIPFGFAKVEPVSPFSTSFR